MILPNHDRYHEYTDAELEGFLREFPRHADRALVFHEQDLRRWIKSELAANDRDAARSRDDLTRHKENQTLGQQTLRWAKLAGVVGVIATVVAIAALLSDTRFSSFRPATSSQATPEPTATATAAPLISPTATRSPSPSPQALQTPAGSSTPAP